MLDHPGFAPELLALAAVRASGPARPSGPRGCATAYPDAPADGLARLATRRFVRSAGAGGATAALAGLFAPLAELAAVLWTHAEPGAAPGGGVRQGSGASGPGGRAAGADPGAPGRGERARRRWPPREAAGDPVEGAWPRAAEAAWRLAAPLTAQAGGWVALRLAARLLPGAAVLAAALGDAAAADRLAARAMAAYRPRPALAGQSQSNHSLGSSA